MTDVPGYTQLRLLGRGGMAAVMLAIQQSLGREVALKVLAPAQDDTAGERFLREARIAASLQHPHIVPIFDFGVHEGQAWLAMQFLPLGTVAPPAGERLEPHAALRIVRDIASALDHAHAHGVVHRDVKPDNILRSESGAMLSDFGIARLVHGESVLTREGTSVGTPHYMSPEQLRGDLLDGRSDLYSLGVVLWQLLTGQPPYSGTDGWAIGTQHIQAPVPRLPDALVALQPLVDALMAKAPAGRPHTGAEVVAWVDRLLPRASFAADAAGPPPAGNDATRPVALTPTDVPAAANVGRRWTRPALVASLALVLAAAGGGAWWWNRSTSVAAPAQPAPEPAPSLAVLPFEDLSAKGDQSFLSDGMAEEVLNRLAQVPGLRVAGRVSAQSFKGKQATVAEVGRALKVNRVLEGTVRREGDRLRVTVRLSNVADGFQAWSQAYDRKVTDVFAVQDEIAGAVVDTLKLKLLATPPHHVPSVEVYDLYLQGRQSLIRGRLGTSLQARTVLRRAVEQDPEYAAAWALLAMAEAFTVEGPADRDERMARSMAAAERAVALDATLGDAYGARGFLRRMDWEWDGALSDLQKAVSLGPGDGRNRLRFGQMLTTVGRFEEGRVELELAVQLDPLLTPAWHQLAQVKFAQRDVAGARRAFERVVALDPEFLGDPTVWADLLLLEGRAEEARTAFAALGDEFAANRAIGVIMADYSLGRVTQARAAMAREVAARPDLDPFFLAGAHAWLGQPDAAFELLERARVQHSVPIMFVAQSPFLAGLRADPRYAALLGRMRMPLPP